MHRNQTIGSILFGKWGDPTGADIRLIDNWEQVTTLNDSKQYTFLVKSGTVFTDIKMFFAELSAALLKTGIGHIDYDSKTHSVCLNDQALLTSTDMIPKTFNKTIKMKFPNFTRADKDIHHDYTPIYLRAGKGDYIIEKSKFGQDVIANHLNKHRYFNNFPPVLRQYKVYLPNPSVLLPPPCICLIKNIQTAINNNIGNQESNTPNSEGIFSSIGAAEMLTPLADNFSIKFGSFGE